MNKKRIIIAAIILLGLIVSSYVWLIRPLDWEQISKKKSPEGTVTAFHMQSKSEAGSAPYGDHIILVPKYRLLGQYYTRPIFAGYCGKDFDYEWTAPNALLISCTTDKVMKKEDNSNGIRIEYKITAAHNTRLDPTGNMPGAVLQ
jgi:hypothetical protein